MSRESDSLCIKCGKKEKQLLQFLCKNCFSEKLISFPKEIAFTVCPLCDKIRFRGKYVKKTDKIFSELIEKSIRLSTGSFKKIIFSFKEKLISLKLLVSIQGNDFTLEKKLPLRVSRDSCRECSRISANYFEAMIQLRLGEDNAFAEKLLAKFLSKMRQKEPLARIIKVEEVNKGGTFFIGSNKSARKAAGLLKKHFNSRLIVSSKLMTVRQGRELKRTTYCLKH